MSVILRTRLKKNGEKTFRLDIYHNGKRRYKALKNLVLLNDSNPNNREYNKEIWRQARKICLQYGAKLDANEYDVTYEAGQKTIVIEWFQSFIDNYTKSDKRNLKGAYNKFKLFLEKKGKIYLTFSELTHHLIEEFMEYLESTGTGEGPSSYYNRFKKVIRNAIRNKLVKENVFLYVEKKIKGKAKSRDVLLINELEELAKTPISNIQVKNAFLFSAMTGLRWCDVKALKWSNIDLKTQYLVLHQAKTNQVVQIDLNDIAIKLLEKCNRDNDLVFSLPSPNGANKLLKDWVKRSGVSKKITWHDARHSFATNLTLLDTNISKTSKLLGHTTTKHTQRYVHLASILKERITDKLIFKLI